MDRGLSLRAQVLIGIAAWGVGAVAYYFALPSVAGAFRLSDAGYYSLQLFILRYQPPGGVGGADASSAALTGLHVMRLVSPVVTSVLVISMVRRVVRWTRGLSVLRARDHAIICGVGSRGFRLVRAMREAGYDVVAIDASDESQLEEGCRALGASFIRGDATRPETLKRAGIDNARFLAAFCSADDVNAEIALQARALSARRGRPLRCVAHVTNPQLCRLLKERELRTDSDTPMFRLRLFNTFTSGATTLLEQHPPFDDLDGGRAAPRVLVVGLGKLGHAVAAALAKEWRETNRTERLHLVLLDPQIRGRVATLLDCHPRLSEVAEVEQVAIDPEMPAFPERFTTSPSPSIAYVCLEQDSLTLAAALALHHSTQRAEFRIVPCVLTDSAIASLLGAAPTDDALDAVWTFDRIVGFPVLDRVFTADVLLGSLARAIHESYLEKALERGEAMGSRPAIVPWDELTEGYREDNRRQADRWSTHLAQIGCVIVPQDQWGDQTLELTDQEVEILARAEHASWMRDRKESPSRFRPRRRRRIRHSDLVPWSELSEEAREKDRDAVRDIPRLLATVGLGVHRGPRDDVHRSTDDATSATPDLDE